MALEEAGVPSVAVHTNVFARLARATALANGMPKTRQAFVPQPVVDKTASDLRAYIEGKDPVSGRPFMQEIIEGLTRPLDAEDLKGLSFERTTPRLLAPDSEENLQQLFIENHWTDFLPIVLPTEERVAAMLKGTHRKPDEVVGRMRPTEFREYWEFTVEKVAVNAVMAGAKPEYFPVILALAASGQSSRSSSTTSITNLAVVNGPIRNEIGMSSGIGAMGPYNHANVTIGRAYSLLSQNLQGGSVPDETYMGTLGNPLAFSFCFAENEEQSPWQPLHVQKGFKPTDNTVSVFFGLRYMQEGYGPRDTWQEKMRLCLAAGAHFPPLVVMDPIVARLFAERGIATKQQFIDWCAENARLPAREYWDDMWVQTRTLPLAEAGVEPFASRLKAKPDEIVHMFEPKDINAVVVGGGTQGAWKMIGARHFKTLSIDAWR
ncbi:MAG TPA: UGSC family (seleno)protein [Stellaceae bacterium]|nr:UGSC family (seleno)protein [Stellaceae bacterium]